MDRRNVSRRDADADRDHVGTVEEYEYGLLGSSLEVDINCRRATPWRHPHPTWYPPTQSHSKIVSARRKSPFRVMRVGVERVTLKLWLSRNQESFYVSAVC